MMHKFKSMFKNRRILYLIFFVVCIVTFTLTIAYAALSTTLNITGNTEVVAANWDVHFDNIICFDDTNSPEITSPTTITFNPVLNEPGDKYFFTVDVVNDGTIDAIIDSVTKLPELTSEQAKYIKYEISYANGETISTRQVVNSGSFVRLKVTVEYRSDITVADLPTSQTVLDLSIKLNYVQKDEEGSDVLYSGTGFFDVVNLKDDIFGSEICLSEECFYVIVTEETDKYMDAILLAKYNLYIGNEVTYFDNNISYGIERSIFKPLENPVVRQDSRALGSVYEESAEDPNTANYIYPWYGTIEFSSSKYWDDNTSTEEFLNHEDNSILPYLNQYKLYLNENGFDVSEIGLLSYEFFEKNSDIINFDLYPWLYSTSYWLSTPLAGNFMIGVSKDHGPTYSFYYNPCLFGIRPFIIYRAYY